MVVVDFFATCTKKATFILSLGNNSPLKFSRSGFLQSEIHTCTTLLKHFLKVLHTFLCSHIIIKRRFFGISVAQYYKVKLKMSGPLGASNNIRRNQCGDVQLDEDIFGVYCIQRIHARIIYLNTCIPLGTWWQFYQRTQVDGRRSARTTLTACS